MKANDEAGEAECEIGEICLRREGEERKFTLMTVIKAGTTLKKEIFFFIVNLRQLNETTLFRHLVCQFVHSIVHLGN